MLKIFTPEEQREIGEITSDAAKGRYPNKAFIMINYRKNFSLVNGEECLSDIAGTLYAIADLEGKDAYSQTICDLQGSDDIENIAVFMNFGIRDDGTYYKL